MQMYNFHPVQHAGGVGVEDVVVGVGNSSKTIMSRNGLKFINHHVNHCLFHA